MIIREKDLYLYDSDELYHYGVLGMKWGVRRAARKETANSRRKAKEANRAYNKAFNKAYNYSSNHPIKQLHGKGKAKSDALWEDAANKAETSRKSKSDYKKEYKSAKQRLMSERQSSDHKESREIKKKHVSEMSNAELSKLNKRMDLEQNYRRLNPSAVQRGLKFAGAVVGATGTVLALEQNSDRLIKLGKRFIKR